MRTRFCATIRSPAFSIRALIAPVRLRVVASGLMIEKVRSIAMICPWNGEVGLRRLYRRHAGSASYQAGRYKRHQAAPAQDGGRGGPMRGSSTFPRLAVDETLSQHLDGFGREL